jgi:type III restriction enzyme
MDTYYIPGVNNLENFGQWTFAELKEVYQIEPDFVAKIKSEFDKMIDNAIGSK